MKRLFVGLELPPTIRQTLLSLQEDIAGARWQSDQQLHMTLCFLGSLDDDLISGIEHAIRGLPLTSFHVRLRGIHCFGSQHQPRTLWAGADPEAPLRQLHAQIRARLDTLGLPPEQQSFQPHITLARFSRGQRGDVTDFLDRSSGFASVAFPVTQVSLFASTPGAGGSSYRVLGRFGLAARAP